jgi:hypothetical protein
MSFNRLNDTWTEEEYDIDYEFYIRLLLPHFFQSLLMYLDQIAFDMIQQLWVAIPAKEAKKYLWWIFSHKFTSCL